MIIKNLKHIMLPYNIILDVENIQKLYLSIIQIEDSNLYINLTRDEYIRQ